MKRIPLTKDHYAIVDDDDYPELIRYRWHLQSRGYAARNSRKGERDKRTLILMHVQIMRPRRGQLCDHVNHNRLDNRRVNLRRCNHSENQYNRKVGLNSTSGYKGVGFSKIFGVWRAHIVVRGRTIFGGSFGTAKEAAVAYNKLAKKHHGRFARLNRV